MLGGHHVNHETGNAIPDILTEAVEHDAVLPVIGVRAGLIDLDALLGHRGMGKDNLPGGITVHVIEELGRDGHTERQGDIVKAKLPGKDRGLLLRRISHEVHRTLPENIFPVIENLHEGPQVVGIHVVNLDDAILASTVEGIPVEIRRPEVTLDTVDLTRLAGMMELAVLGMGNDERLKEPNIFAIIFGDEGIEPVPYLISQDFTLVIRQRDGGGNLRAGGDDLTVTRHILRPGGEAHTALHGRHIATL